MMWGQNAALVQDAGLIIGLVLGLGLVIVQLMIVFELSRLRRSLAQLVKSWASRWRPMSGDLGPGVLGSDGLISDDRRPEFSTIQLARGTGYYPSFGNGWTDRREIPFIDEEKARRIEAFRFAASQNPSENVIDLMARTIPPEGLFDPRWQAVRLVAPLSVRDEDGQFWREHRERVLPFWDGEFIAIHILDTRYIDGAHVTALLAAFEKLLHALDDGATEGQLFFDCVAGSWVAVFRKPFFHHPFVTTVAGALVTAAIGGIADYAKGDDAKAPPAVHHARDVCVALKGNCNFTVYNGGGEGFDVRSGDKPKSRPQPASEAEPARPLETLIGTLREDDHFTLEGRGEIIRLVDAREGFTIRVTHQRYRITGRWSFAYGPTPVFEMVGATPMPH